MTGGNSAQFSAGIMFEIIEVDQAKDDLKDLDSLLTKVMNNTLDGNKRGSDATTESILKLGEMRHALGQIEAGSQALLAPIKQWGSEIMAIGNSFNDSYRGFEMVFKDSELAQTKFEETLQVAEKTSLKTLDALGMVTRLQRLGVDALQTFNKEVDIGGEKIMKSLTGLELVNDLIAGSGQDATMILNRHLPLAIQGNAKNFAAMFDGLEGPYKAAYKAADTAQERWEVIAKAINENFGGIAASLEGTFNFTADNIQDTITNIKGMLGQDIGKIFANPEGEGFMNHLLKLLEEIKEDEEFLGILRDSFRSIAESLNAIAIKAIGVARYFAMIVKEHPWMLKMALYFAGIAGSVGLLASKLGHVLVFFANLKMVLPDILGIATKIMAGLGPMLPFILGAAAALGVLHVALKDVGGLLGGIEIGLKALKGLFQLVASFNGESMSMDTELAKELEAAGILDFVVKVGWALGDVKMFLIEAAEVVQSYFDRVVAAVTPLAEAIANLAQVLFGQLFRSLGIIAGGFDDAFGDENASAIEKFDGFMNSLVTTIEQVSVKLTTFVNWLTETAKALQPVTDFVALFLGTMLRLFYELGKETMSELFKTLVATGSIIYDLGVVFGELLSVFGFLDPVIGALINLFGALGEEFGFSSEKIDLMSVAVWALTAPLQIISMVMQGLAFILQTLGEGWDMLMVKLEPFFEWLAEKLDWITEKWKKFLEFKDAIIETADEYGGWFTAGVSALNPLAGAGVAIDQLAGEGGVADAAIQGTRTKDVDLKAVLAEGNEQRGDLVASIREQTPMLERLIENGAGGGISSTGNDGPSRAAQWLLGGL